MLGTHKAVYTHAPIQADDKDWFGSTMIRKLIEPINTGDVIFYWHPAFKCGTMVAERYATDMEGSQEKQMIALNQCQGMKCGLLQDHPRGGVRCIMELVEAGQLPGKRSTSMEAIRLEKLMSCFKKDYQKVGAEQGIP